MEHRFVLMRLRERDSHVFRAGIAHAIINGVPLVVCVCMFALTVAFALLDENGGNGGSKRRLRPSPAPGGEPLRVPKAWIAEHSRG